MQLGEEIFLFYNNFYLTLFKFNKPFYSEKRWCACAEILHRFLIFREAVNGKNV